MIENIAISDILILLVYYTPKIPSSLYGKWVLGDHMCVFIAILWHSTFCNETLITALLSVARFMIMKRKQGRGEISRKCNVIIMVLVVIISLVPNVLFVTPMATKYSISHLTCIWTTETISVWYATTFGLFYIFVPIIIVVFSSIIMLCIIYKAQKSKYQNTTCKYSGPIKSILAVCVCFVISYIPTLTSLLSVMSAISKSGHLKLLRIVAQDILYQSMFN